MKPSNFVQRTIVSIGLPSVGLRGSGLVRIVVGCGVTVFFVVLELVIEVSGNKMYSFQQTLKCEVSVP